MKAILKSNPWCRHYLGKAEAYRIASMYFTADQSGYGLFRAFMRDNAKTAIAYARMRKGVV